MLQIYKIEDTKLPAVVLDDEVMTGFRSIEELEEKIKISFDLESETEEEKTEE
jgi:hypothetical protein